MLLLNWFYRGFRLFSGVYSENAALFKRLMKMRSNPPTCILHYGFNYVNIKKRSQSVIQHTFTWHISFTRVLSMLWWLLKEELPLEIYDPIHTTKQSIPLDRSLLRPILKNTSFVFTLRIFLHPETKWPSCYSNVGHGVTFFFQIEDHFRNACIFTPHVQSVLEAYHTSGLPRGGSPEERSRGTLPGTIVSSHGR